MYALGDEITLWWGKGAILYFENEILEQEWYNKGSRFSEQCPENRYSGLIDKTEDA